MNLRRELSKEVQTRLNAGERKSAIYTALKTKFSAVSVERALAQWPTPEAKVQNKTRNVPLIIITVFFALLHILQMTAAFQPLETSQRLMVLPLAALPLIIYAYIIYGIKNCNLIGYLLVLLMSIRALLNVAQAGAFTSQAMMLAAMSVAAIALTLIQKRKLFPNTSWFLRHKRDANGEILF